MIPKFAHDHWASQHLAAGYSSCHIMLAPNTLPNVPKNSPHISIETSVVFKLLMPSITLSYLLIRTQSICNTKYSSKFLLYFYYLYFIHVPISVHFCAFSVYFFCFDFFPTLVMKLLVFRSNFFYVF